MNAEKGCADEGPIVVDSQTGVRRLLFIELFVARFDATTVQVNSLNTRFLLVSGGRA